MIKRNIVTINRDPQLSLLEIPANKEHRISARVKSTIRVFEQPNPETIFIGQTRLRDHLKTTKILAPLITRKFLLEIDWGTMEACYASSGRPPYAPMSMMGLILYGVYKGITSLRHLEEFARTDLGCMWVTGGIAPDHSVIGKFILRHKEQITDELFASVTSAVLVQTGSNGRSLAGDGTVIEAACSHYGLLKQEAIGQALITARETAEKKPNDADVQIRLSKAIKTADALASHIDKKKANNQSIGVLRISNQEPEAVVQRQKRGRGSAPSYKPSILVNDQRIITAHALHASSETAVIAPMIEQSERVSGDKIDDLLLDAGYCSHRILNEAIDRDINLLCPEGRVPGEGKSSTKKYTKGQFEYDSEFDGYWCPAGNFLNHASGWKGSDTLEGYRTYKTKACGECPKREQCTQSKAGRKIIRYAGDEYKEALRMVMQQEKAQIHYSSRQAWVEPVFSVLRGNQNLNRFRRKGLALVSIEFGLHVLAYNIGRLIAFLLLQITLIYTIWGCLSCLSRVSPLEQKIEQAN